MATRILTPEFRVCFPNVFRPRKKENPSDKTVFDVTMIFEKDTDLSGFKKLIEEATQEKWGGTPPAGLRSPIRVGTKKDKDPRGYENVREEFKGKYVIVARSYGETPPGVLNERKEHIMDHSTFYGGCYAVAYVSAYGYHNGHNKGVSICLEGIMKVKDGEHFVSRPKVEDMFESFQPVVKETSDVEEIAMPF